MKKILFVLITAFACLGCANLGAPQAGVPFTRLSSDRFELGKTTRTEIESILGAPQGESKTITNGQTINATSYNYSTRTQSQRLLVRMQVFFFFKNILVGHLYTSNFDADMTNFDDSQINNFQKGKTKIDEVIKKLGAPSGEGIYPLTNEEHERKIMYYYPKKLANVTLFTKEMTIFYKPDKIISNIVFSENVPVK